MEELIISVATKKKARDIKLYLEKKFEGIQISPVKGASGNSKKFNLEDEPLDKSTKLKLINESRLAGKSGLGISVIEFRNLQKKWLKEKRNEK